MTPVGIDGLSTDAIGVLQQIRSHDGAAVPASAILDAHTTKRQWERIRGTLIDRGLIEVIGHGSKSRYAATARDSQGAGASSAGWGQGSPKLRSKPKPAAPELTLTTTQRRILRARVIDHLSRRALTEETLASHLGADPGHVHHAVAEVLATGGIVRRLDGTLRTAEDNRTARAA